MSQAAFFTFRLSGVADGSAVKNDAVAKIRRMFRRKYLSKCHFDLDGVFCSVHKTEAIGNADAMGVHNGRTGDFIYVTQNEVCGFSAYTGQGGKLLHGLRHFAIVLCQQHLGAGNHIASLCSEETAGMNIFLNLFHICLRKCLQSGKSFKKRRGDFVYALVSTLSGKADGEKKLIVLFPIQSAVGQRIFLHQQPNDFIDLFLSTHRRNP